MAPKTSEFVLLPKVDDPVNRIVLRTTKSDENTWLPITYYGEWEEIINYLNEK